MHCPHWCRGRVRRPRSGESPPLLLPMLLSSQQQLLSVLRHGALPSVRSAFSSSVPVPVPGGGGDGAPSTSLKGGQHTRRPQWRLDADATLSPFPPPPLLLIVRTPTRLWVLRFCILPSSYGLSVPPVCPLAARLVAALRAVPQAARTMKHAVGSANATTPPRKRLLLSRGRRGRRERQGRPAEIEWLRSVLQEAHKFSDTRQGNFTPGSRLRASSHAASRSSPAPWICRRRPPAAGPRLESSSALCSPSATQRPRRWRWGGGS